MYQLQQNASLYLSVPNWRLFQFPPAPTPRPIPPAPREFSWDRPFNIPPHIYDLTTSLDFPLYGISTYLLSTLILNHLNRLRENKPWPWSRTQAFRYFTLAHNIGLSLFSCWALFGFCTAVYAALPATSSTPYHVYAIDALCKIHGPSTSDPFTDDRTQVPTMQSLPHHASGRLWTQGFDYFAWMFYMSKFYEVMDSVIILLKGRNTSLLQTYHHAGVILCAWSSIRYVSPASLIGYMLNAAIHTIMYTYYALTVLNRKVPGSVKRLLTSMQIAQFLVGGIIAWTYTLITYDFVPHHEKTWEVGGAGQSNGGIRIEQSRVPCLETSGEVFSLVLTSLYLCPLTWMFVDFFFRSYVLNPKFKTQ